MFFLITGRPGIGKTTFVKRLAADLRTLKGWNVTGFYTEEVRELGRRIGFDIVVLPCGSRYEFARKKEYATFDTKIIDAGYVLNCTVLAHVKELVSKQLSASSVIVIDELGAMEIKCGSFIEWVERLFIAASENNVEHFVITAGRRFVSIAEALGRSLYGSVRVVELDESNRDVMYLTVLKQFTG